jgi:hypothetical protein
MKYMQQDILPTPQQLIERSAATPAFRQAFEEFQNTRKPNQHIQFGYGDPPVKVMRAICGLLEIAAEFEVDRVEVSGRSGCSNYVGRVVVNGGEKTFSFVWDCAWKAREAGLTDFMGFPDQQQAARIFGYRCFEKFEEAR